MYRKIERSLVAGDEHGVFIERNTDDRFPDRILLSGKRENKNPD